MFTGGGGGPRPGSQTPHTPCTCVPAGCLCCSIALPAQPATARALHINWPLLDIHTVHIPECHTPFSQNIVGQVVGPLSRAHMGSASFRQVAAAAEHLQSSLGPAWLSVLGLLVSCFAWATALPGPLLQPGLPARVPRSSAASHIHGHMSHGQTRAAQSCTEQSRAAA